MFIIGTAGHVDHGKTLLIKALTGIDTDRLPEEKKRGLTIDLGFAHFPGNNGIEIGVVDVPGHERFIRNMTAGAWGIDLALLVVAADDGWMYQSENHLNVLAAMGIDEIIVVVTKTDIAQPGRIKDVAGFAAAAVEEKTGRTPEAIAVSAMDGTGIEELRSLIVKSLAGISGAAGSTTGSAPPLMYIDRIFNVKGAGLVVTGSLREGSVSRDDTLLLLPEGREVRVRGLQTYDRETGTAVPASRTAINITGAAAEQLSRGHCLTKSGSGFTAETEVVILMSGKNSNIRNHSEAEFAAGTAHTIGTIHFMKNSDCARVVLTNAIALRSGQPLVIIRKGGSRITGSGIVIWKGETTGEERLKIASAIASIPLPFTRGTETSLKLAVAGRMRLRLGEPPRGQDSQPEGSVLCGSWLFSKDAFSALSDKITASAAAPGGVRTVELNGKLNVPDDAVKAVCARMADDGLISEKGGILFSGKSREPDLSSAAKQILAEAEKGGKLGLDLAAVNIPGAKKELRNLTREGLIVPLTDKIFYTEENFRRLTETILDELKKNETFDIAHTKNKTGLSRKYIIPLLEKMEDKGMVKREDSLRRVL